MRGIGTVIFVGFISIILFGLIAPPIVEPIVEIVVSDPAVQDNVIDEQAMTSGLMSSLFVWAPLFVLGASVVSAIVWYFRKERTSARRVR